MANSPLLLPGSSEKSAVNKTKLSKTTAASNGTTPEPASNGSGPDLAEQMNDEEKQKYVKG